MDNTAMVEIFLKNSGLVKDKRLRKQFLSEIIEFSKESDDEDAKIVKRFINSIKIPGFRKAETAPDQIIAKHLFEFPSYRPEPIEILAFAWEKSRDDLSNSCSEYLDSFEKSQLDEIRDAAASEEECSAFDELARNFAKDHDDLDFSIVKLMLSIHLYLIQNDQYDEIEIDEDNIFTLSDLWNSCLEHLHNLDLDSIEWKEYDIFHEAVLALREEKSTGIKHKEKIEQFQQSIDEFVEKGQELITNKSYFEYLRMNDCLSWTAENVSDGDIDSLSNDFEEFKKKFVNYIDIELKTKEHGKTREEEKERRKLITELEIIEDELEGLYKDLTPKLQDELATKLEKDEIKESEIDETDDDKKTETEDKKKQSKEPQDPIKGESVPKKPRDDTKPESEKADLEDSVNKVSLLKAKEKEEQADEHEADGSKTSETDEHPKIFEIGDYEHLPVEEETTENIIKKCIQSPGRIEPWNQLTAELLRVGDLSGAYWISRSL